MRNSQFLQADGKNSRSDARRDWPFTIPVINGEADFDEPNVKLIACGGQSTIPICTPDRVPRPADFEEIKATIPSQMTRLVARLSSAGTRMLIA